MGDIIRRKGRFYVRYIEGYRPAVNPDGSPKLWTSGPNVGKPKLDDAGKPLLEPIRKMKAAKGATTKEHAKKILAAIELRITHGKVAVSAWLCRARSAAHTRVKDRDMAKHRRGIGLVLLIAAAAPRAAVAAPPDFRAQADAILRHDVDLRGPGVAVLVARDDEILYRSASGLADIELGVPMAADDVFRIGSITKTVTAAAVLRLVAEGKMSLDDPLARFLPAFPGADKITIARLLDHTAGISDGWEASPCEILDTPKLVGLIARHAPDSPPGTAWRYSNSGYMLLGAVITKVTGQAWDRATHDLVLAPLGLAHTAHYGDDAVVPRAVQGYSVDKAGRVVHPSFVTISGPQAAGGLSSTVDDLFRLIRGLATAHLLSPRAFADMTTARRTADGRPIAYGYGVFLGSLRGEPVIAHDGGIEGFASQYLYLPHEQITAIVLANSDSGEPNARALARRLAALAAGRPYRSFRDVRPDAQTLAALAGSYRIEGASRHVLSLDNGQLYVQRDQGPRHRLITAEGGLVYYAGDGTDYFEIVRDKSGRVTALDFYADGMPPARHEARLQ